METWKWVLRKGLLPLLSGESLKALREALATDDPQLIQGGTTKPGLPLACVQDLEPEGACLIAYAGWKGNDLQTIGEVEEYFARVCYDMDYVLEEPAGCRPLLNWYDDSPRDVMRAELLREIKAEQVRRIFVCSSQPINSTSSVMVSCSES